MPSGPKGASMTDVDRAILKTWQQIGPKILADPEELAKRIARRRSATLTRPLRHWCIAIRASDRRITPAHWILTPEHAMDLNHPDHPYEPIEHTVTIRTHALDKFCRPVLTHPWGEQVADVAKWLGCSPSGLRNARNREFFRPERRIKGLGGKRGAIVPLISSQVPLDPGSGNCFQPPHPICGNLWQHLPDVLRSDFEQTVTRRSVFRRLKGPHLPPDVPVYKDEIQHIGWRWVCPGCKKEVKTIYYPMEVRTLCYYLGFDPAAKEFKIWNGKTGRRILDADRTSPVLATFACGDCHRILSFSNTNQSGWNTLVSHLSAALLFGHEVQPPPSFKIGHDRKRTRIRRLGARPPTKRQAVLRRLLNGWSNARIARDLGISIWALDNHIRILCRQEDVPDRHALAAKLGASVSPPLNQEERAAKRRIQVQDLLLSGLNRTQIMAALDMSLDVLKRDIQCIYRLHGVQGYGEQARRALAAKLGLELPPTPNDLLRQQILPLHQSGLTCNQIAQHLNLPYMTTYALLYRLHRAPEISNPESASEIANSKTEIAAPAISSSDGE
jgi:DNA-binding CsgD family transcriptional regulator